MSFSVVVGAGGTGRAVARQLAEAGEQVRLVSRRGTGSGHPGVEAVAADANDADRLTELTDGASTLFNCAMPPYDRWPTDWPPLAAALLTTAERTGAGYVMLGNTYPYGPVTAPITETTPMAPTTVKGRVRAQMWTDVLEAYDAGRVRGTEVRGSDFLGVDTLSVFNLVVLPGLLAGQRAAYPGNLDVAHSWTYIEDAARTLIAASRYDGAWGQVWHAPSTSTLPVGDLTRRLAEIAGAPEPQLVAMPAEELRKLGETDSIMAELIEMQYIDQEVHVLDSAHTERVLGVSATPLDEVLTETAKALLHQR
ncbi:NAD-dependent epimerase/dehydratase family protein [Kribbella sp. CA-294648]|uniref:NAD-dependent epimerase/dehydratase family protein n=1 Tax=Kribbella sp. CA-294648 TaxID=3239948 RepID=UPI003D8E97F8